jgi:hypothetical protein
MVAALHSPPATTTTNAFHAANTRCGNGFVSFHLAVLVHLPLHQAYKLKLTLHLISSFSRFPESAPPFEYPHSRPRGPPPPLPSPPLTPPEPEPEPEPEPSALDDLAWLFSHAKARLQSRMGDLDRLIGDYTHMQEMPDDQYALHMLRKIASCVKPIMRKRGWRVGTLSEFYPEQGNLLGV